MVEIQYSDHLQRSDEESEHQKQTLTDEQLDLDEVDDDELHCQKVDEVEPDDSDTTDEPDEALHHIILHDEVEVHDLCDEVHDEQVVEEIDDLDIHLLYHEVQ
jgi:hypothetical protein